MRAIEFPSGLSDGVVALRPLHEDDAPAYARAFRDDADLGRLLGLDHEPDETWSRDEARRSREGAQQGHGVALAVTEASGDRLLGEMMLTDFDWNHRRCELGYFLVPGARGHGIATAAASLVVRWVFDHLDFLRIEIATTAGNLASQKLARRLGFTHEALQRERDLERGHRVDIVQFGLLREEWLAAGS